MSSNAMQACIDIFFSPQSAFTSIKQKKGWSWLPFLLVMVASSSVFAYYFNVVDIDFYNEQSIEQGAAMTGLSYEELKEMSPPADASSSMLQTILSICFGLIFGNLIIALYYLLITKMTAKNELSFGDWFGFSWWVNLPLVLSYLASILVIFFASDSQIPMHSLQPTSINSLLLSLPISSPWHGFFEAITLFSIWTIALAFFGLKAWLNTETPKAIIIAIIPSVILYGAWALYIGL
jgi:hypothetical protein